MEEKESDPHLDLNEQEMQIQDDFISQSSHKACTYDYPKSKHVVFEVNTIRTQGPGLLDKTNTQTCTKPIDTSNLQQTAEIIFTELLNQWDSQEEKPMSFGSARKEQIFIYPQLPTG